MKSNAYRFHLLGYELTVRRGRAGWDGFLQKDGGPMIQVVQNEPDLDAAKEKACTEALEIHTRGQSRRDNNPCNELRGRWMPIALSN